MGDAADGSVVRVGEDTLGSIPAGIRTPRYDRAALTPGIVHFGVGNFHRAHQAVYLDDLMCAGQAMDWGIRGAGVLQSDRRMRDALVSQDYLTTVVEQDAGASRARIVGPICGFVEPRDSAAIIAALSDPSTRIVSMTITEGGYFIDPATGRFDPANPDIAADAARGGEPETVFGMIVAALSKRRASGLPPFTVMSCDNIPHNGVVARNAVTGLAGLSHPGFSDWIAGHVAFPNAMVDRIATATDDTRREALRRDFGIEDAWPVFCESFRQWVIEDSFTAGRPPLEDAGVQFVPDVTPYEAMKIRILNGGHALIAYPAGLLGLQFAHDAMQHPLISSFLDKVEKDEIIPMVPPVPDTDLEAYFENVRVRFANPNIRDTVRRLCLDGSNRQPKFILPSVADRLAAGAGVAGLALESALWCRYCFGETEAGETIEPNDPNWDRLRQAAGQARDDPSAWLAMDETYGRLGRQEPFAAAFSLALSNLWRHGVERTLASYLNGGS